ncbi:DUF3291 domain-containing protein [Clavibacter tessellarius]|uniref:DUF3291 domain-containing protein n=1 Tax=Clavibacter tessellarius TaxID=31965 RepID=A0A225CAY0_9MICO|nr:hypothetical protein [Clavibacter michiganensis]OQJ63679.1 hypothetical protein B5P24_12100 [Clavibacter michiganensis subsp. tessellarius]UKF33342.1 DUF3291 domain-containing protein [Clavibacter michiganensis subsp. tessellarius]
MVQLRWSAGPAAGSATGEVVVMASRFELTGLRAVPGFFADSIASWRQSRRAPGCVGVALEALPLRRTFWTLSAWESEEAIQEYARTSPHSGAARRQRVSMASSVFVFWRESAELLPVDWSEARSRVAARSAEG